MFFFFKLYEHTHFPLTLRDQGKINRVLQGPGGSMFVRYSEFVSFGSYSCKVGKSKNRDGVAI